MRARLNEYCLERVVQFCLEPLFCAEGDIAPSRRVAQPRLAALMQVSKVGMRSCTEPRDTPYSLVTLVCTAGSADA